MEEEDDYGLSGLINELISLEEDFISNEERTILLSLLEKTEEEIVRELNDVNDFSIALTPFIEKWNDAMNIDYFLDEIEDEAIAEIIDEDSLVRKIILVQSLLADYLIELEVEHPETLLYEKERQIFEFYNFGITNLEDAIVVNVDFENGSIDFKGPEYKELYEIYEKHFELDSLYRDYFNNVFLVKLYELNQIDDVKGMLDTFRELSKLLMKVYNGCSKNIRLIQNKYRSKIEYNLENGVYDVSDGESVLEYLNHHKKHKQKYKIYRKLDEKRAIYRKNM